MKTVKKTVKKYQAGGSTNSAKRKGATYNESKDKVEVTRSKKDPSYSGDVRKQTYKKTITGNDKEGGKLTVTKGGRTSTFNIPKEKVSEQRTIAKKETGYMKKGGAIKMQAGGSKDTGKVVTKDRRDTEGIASERAKGNTVYSPKPKPKPVMKKGGATKKSK